MPFEIIVEIPSQNDFDVLVETTPKEIEIELGFRPSAKKSVRQEWDDPYVYTGLAPYGTLETKPLWDITRSEFDVAGSLVEEKKAIQVKWSDRLTETYT